VARAVKTVLTGNRAAPPSESDEFGAFVRRVIRAYARRVADRDEVDAAMREAVTGLHGNPYSWADIGRALGITRQAAQARFGQPSSSPRLTDV
jgi:hypothetical protein